MVLQNTGGYLLGAITLLPNELEIVKLKINWESSFSKLTFGPLVVVILCSNQDGCKCIRCLVIRNVLVS